MLAVLLFLSPVDSWAEKNYRIVVFGDSLTSGFQLQEQDAFPAKLRARLRAGGYERLEVISMSKEQATTANATNETSRVLEQLPDLVIVQLGFNDTKRGVVSSAISYNLSTILAALTVKDIYVILVGVKAPPTIDENYPYEVEQLFYTLANHHKVSLYPDALAGIENNPQLTMADGRHPNTSGVDVMVNGLLPLVDAGLRWRYEIYQEELNQSKKRRNAPAAAPTLH